MPVYFISHAAVFQSATKLLEAGLVRYPVPQSRVISHQGHWTFYVFCSVLLRDSSPVLSDDPMGLGKHPQDSLWHLGTLTRDPSIPKLRTHKERQRSSLPATRQYLPNTSFPRFETKGVDMGLFSKQAQSFNPQLALACSLIALLLQLWLRQPSLRHTIRCI